MCTYPQVVNHYSKIEHRHHTGHMIELTLQYITGDAQQTLKNPYFSQPLSYF